LGYNKNQTISHNGENRKMKKRLAIALGTGAALGLICVLGASLRLGWTDNQLLIISLWFNRLIMGLLIGMAGDLMLIENKFNWILRGAVLGLVVSAAYFLTAGANDWISFLVGSVYGVIIEYVLRQKQL
jgi:hypothetical protein